MFEALKAFPADPILGISAAYAADTSRDKVDVGVGVYRDESGATPVMRAVRLAAERVAATETTKAYLPTSGNAGFNRAISDLVLGAAHPAVAEGRAVTLQTPGGCGALRLAADLVHLVAPQAPVALSAPTWPNHPALIGGAGLKTVAYPYYDAASHSLTFSAMLGSLAALPPGAVVLVQPTCHNPTGADLAAAQWEELIDLMKHRELLPLLDVAYQGLGEGLDADVHWLRRVTSEVPECLVTVSCSKNFGLYRERTGAIVYVGRSAAETKAVHTNLMMLARRMYSMPPDHGAALVAAIWADAGLRAEWQRELDAMRERLAGLRAQLAAALAVALPTRDYSFIARQRGMFSLLGLGPDVVEALRRDEHIYCAPDSRINIAGLSPVGIERLVAAIARLT
jgi:aspartate aminotransferase